MNFPLRDGIDDEAYEHIFQPLISKVMEMFQPSAVVLQCGADSLTGDRLGCFNLTLKGHGKCVEFIKKYNIPLLLVGGGGYTIRNVARCWTYETAVALDQEIPNELPYNDYFEYFGPDFKLHISPSNMSNQNSPEYLDKIKTRLCENLRMLPHAPGVQAQTIPDDAIAEEEEDEDKQNPDERVSIRASEKRIQRDNEYSDSEDEGDNRKEIRSNKKPLGSKKLKSETNGSVNSNNGQLDDKQADDKAKDETSGDAADAKGVEKDAKADAKDDEGKDEPMEIAGEELENLTAGGDKLE